MTVPALRRVAAGVQGQSARVAGDAAISLAQICGPQALELAEQLACSADRLVALLGSCAAVLSDAERVSVHAIKTLVAPLDELSEVTSPHADTVTSLVGRCLTRLPPAHREAAAEAIRKQHAGAKVMDVLSLTASLLALVFDHRPAPQEVSSLTSIQRAALETIRDHGAFKLGDGIFANYALLLRGWGLPDSVEKLTSWLEGTVVHRPDA